MHENNRMHKWNVEVASKIATGQSQSATTGDARIYLTVTPEDELYARTIRTVHTICVRQLSLESIYALLELQNSNGAIVSYDHASTTGEGLMSEWLEAGARVWRGLVRDRAQNSIIASLFPRGSPFGFMGDGSTDRALYEQEAVVFRFLGEDARPFNTFYDLPALDLSKGTDGHSPDAQCITSCYVKSFEQLDQYEGFLHLSSWKQALIGGSLDGASVNMGEHGGVAKMLKDLSETTLTMIHAVAHVQQLSMANGFDDVSYIADWKVTVQAVYMNYNLSGKKRFGLEEVANELDSALLKLQGSHGIRWAAAQAKTLKALIVDLPVVVVDLERTAKAQLGLSLSQLTPSVNFIGKTFWQKFENAGGRATRWKATVKATVLSDRGVAAADMFTLAYNNKTTMQVSKAELVGYLTDEESTGLADHPQWKLRSQLTDWLFVAFTAFMLDVHHQLAILSKSYQSNSLVVFDVSRNLNRTLRDLRKLKTTPGEEEAKFLAAVKENGNADCIGAACQLYGGEAGRRKLKDLR